MADLAIEETNRIRASLGMKPLPIPSGGGGSGPSFKPGKGKGNDSSSESSSEEDEEKGSTLESRQAQGYDNWKALQDQADAKRKREAKAADIKKARDAAQRYQKLEGKGLADDDKDDVDAKTWLLQQKKRRKRIEKEREKVERLAQELAEREAGVEHTAADLKGVNIAHSLDDLEGAGEHIMTLKDATIDQNEEEGDELENVDLREKDTLNEKLSLKKKKPVYDPHADEEQGGSKILKHYDEAIDGKKRKRFQLEAQGISNQDREAMKQVVGAKLKAQPISLDIIKDDLPISDYAELKEAKMKKPKKKKPKATRQKAADQDDIFPAEQVNARQINGSAMDVDTLNGRPIASKPKPAENASFVDDDDLQASLAAQRRVALKKRKRTKPADIARELREETSATPTGNTDEGAADDGGLTIDETTEFVAYLQRVKEEEDEEKPKRSKPRSTTPIEEESPEGNEDVEMGGRMNDSEGHEDLDVRIKRETSTPAAPDLTETGLEDEATLNNGLGSTLNMLSQRGLIAPRREEDIVGLHRERQRFLLEKQRREAEIERKARLQRERDRASGKLDHMSAREREEYARYENKQRDQIESRIMNDIFSREYKPDVQLKYVDEFGRSMNQKEAFKHLSHQFHGKGSGKQKTEKHLKKIEDERKEEAKSSLDASQATGMNNAMGVSQKKNRTAGVRLA